MVMEQPIYLDYNATCPLDPQVISVIEQSLIDDWGNPSSQYKYGQMAQKSISQARDQISQMINCDSNELIFTSGGTEANNLAISSAVKQAERNSSTISFKPHVIVSNVEHDSVIKVVKDLEESSRIELSLANVDEKTGRLSTQTVLDLIQENTCLISIMHANNETGIIMPIEEISQKLNVINQKRSVKCPKIYFHSDAAQSVGKIPVDVAKLGVDYLTIVGHKFYGPRIGAIFAKNLEKKESQTPIYPLLFGGGQERGYRPGTENTPLIKGLGKAANLVHQNLGNYTKAMKESRDYFQNKLIELIPGIEVNFCVEGRLPNTLSLCLPSNIPNAREILEKSQDTFCASVGAACHSNNINAGQGSSILISSGLPEDRAKRTVRFSVGRSTSFEQIDLVVEHLVKMINNKN